MIPATSDKAASVKVPCRTPRYRVYRISLLIS